MVVAPTKEVKALKCLLVSFLVASIIVCGFVWGAKWMHPISKSLGRGEMGEYLYQRCNKGMVLFADEDGTKYYCGRQLEL